MRNYSRLLANFPKIKFHIYFSFYFDKKKFDMLLLETFKGQEDRITFKQIFTHQNLEGLFPVLWSKNFDKKTL